MRTYTSLNPPVLGLTDLSRKYKSSNIYRIFIFSELCERVLRVGVGGEACDMNGRGGVERFVVFCKI